MGSARGELSSPPERVAPGIFRISIPLPFPPREVAAWMVQQPDGWMLVDTGIDTPDGRAALCDGAKELGIGPGDLARVVLTHVHIDHYGLAGPIRAWSGAPVTMHATEEALARRWVDSWAQDRSAVEADLRAGGAPSDVLPQLLAAVDVAHRLYPEFYPDLVLDGARGSVSGVDGWEWIGTPGHSPGHICLYDAESEILISGDHILPRISPNIGADVYAEDPLTAYLGSLQDLRDLPVQLVLPSHGPPFIGFRDRIDEIIAHHEERNQQIIRALAAPRTGFEVTQEVFGALPPESLVHALREILAHLVHLHGSGRVEKIPGMPEKWAV